MGAYATEIDTAPVEHLAETGSTNEDALALGRSGVVGPRWIVADRQVAGRGRQGRVWQSPVGNLYCTLLAPVAAAARDLPQVSHVAAVALVTALEDCLGRQPGLRIKWPNDVLLDGAKLAGILVEGTRTAEGLQLCAIGFGVNCSSCPEDLPYRATSIAATLGEAVAPEALFKSLRGALDAAFAVWDDGRGYPAIRERWLAHALPLETALVVRGPHEPISGRFRGIDDKGRLLLMGPDGPVTVEAGDVILN